MGIDIWFYFVPPPFFYLHPVIITRSIGNGPIPCLTVNGP